MSLLSEYAQALQIRPERLFEVFTPTAPFKVTTCGERVTAGHINATQKASPTAGWHGDDILSGVH